MIPVFNSQLIKENSYHIKLKTFSGKIDFLESEEFSKHLLKTKQIYRTA